MGNKEAVVEDDIAGLLSSSVGIKFSPCKPYQSFGSEDTIVKRKASQDMVGEFINVCPILGARSEPSFKMKLAADANQGFLFGNRGSQLVFEHKFLS